MKEREKNPLLHHKVREFDTQRKVFEQLTVASTVLNDPQTAFQEIDRVLHAALRYKRPVYIEIPRDMVTRFGIEHHAPARIHETSDPAALAEALDEALQMINRARQPVILADVEVHRFGLQGLLLALIEKANIPFASTILGKSVMSEQHPLYLGVYEGAMGRDDVRDYVESSDCVDDARDVYDGHQFGNLHGSARPGPIDQRDEREVVDPLPCLRGGAVQGFYARSGRGRSETSRTGSIIRIPRRTRNSQSSQARSSR